MDQNDILKELNMDESDLIHEESVAESDEINFDSITNMSQTTEASPNKSSASISEGIHVKQLKDVKVPITVELGRTKKTLAELEAMTKGSIIALGTKVDDPIRISCQGKAFAEAQVVDMEGEIQLIVTKVLAQN